MGVDGGGIGVRRAARRRPTPSLFFSLSSSLVGAPAHDPRGAGATYTYGTTTPSAAAGGWAPPHARGGGASGSRASFPAASDPFAAYADPAAAYAPRGAYLGGGGGVGAAPASRVRVGGSAALSLAAAALDALAAIAPGGDPGAVTAAAGDALGVPVRVAALGRLLSWRGLLF